MTLPPVIGLPWRFERAPPPFEGNAIRHPENVIRALIGDLTKPGAKIFDPFAGLGTTLFAAEALKRDAYGIEADRLRYEWVAGQLRDWTRLIHGDALRAGAYDLPKMDLILTCPPFMRRSERWNPMAAGDPAKAGYDRYLRQMGQAFAQMVPLLKPRGRLVLLLENIPGRVFTPLVWDVGRKAESLLRLDGETTIVWTGRPEERTTQVLVYTRPR